MIFTSLEGDGGRGKPRVTLSHVVERDMRGCGAGKGVCAGSHEMEKTVAGNHRPTPTLAGKMAVKGLLFVFVDNI